MTIHNHPLTASQLQAASAGMLRAILVPVEPQPTLLNAVPRNGIERKRWGWDDGDHVEFRFLPFSPGDTIAYGDVKLTVKGVRPVRLGELTGKDVDACGYPFSSDFDQLKSDLGVSDPRAWVWLVEVESGVGK